MYSKMSQLFALRLVEGTATIFSAVPPKLKKEVAEILIKEAQRPDLVSKAYGGTASG